MIQYAYETCRGDNVLEFQFPSITRLGQEVVERIVSVASRYGCDLAEAAAIRLGVHVAVINAIRHGNGCDPAKMVRVGCHVAENGICVEIEDEGGGFAKTDVADPTAPENISKPGGRGLMMMRHHMSSVEYNDAGNQVTMRRQFGAPAACLF